MIMDTYTKIVFTAIAIALWGLLLQPILMPKVVGASSGVMDVNIKQVNGRRVNNALDINLAQVNKNNLFYNYVPVAITEKK